VSAQHAASDAGDRYLADIAQAGQAYLPICSNATRGAGVAPRATFRRVRGDYDKVMTGVRAFTRRRDPYRAR
jgi:hypothetical protein